MQKIIKQIFAKLKSNKKSQNKLIQTIQTQTQKISENTPPASTTNMLQQFKQTQVSAQQPEDELSLG
jgi:hypothetical protein